MGLRSRIEGSFLYRKWKTASLGEQISWIIWVGVPAMIAWIDLFGKLPKFNIYFIATIILFLLSGFVIFLNAAIRHERDEAKQALKDERDRSSAAIHTVYAQKDEEIEKLELDVATWKDRASSYQDKLSICERERDQWKDDCRFLHGIRNNLMTEKQELQERLQRCYESHPELNPTHTISCAMDMILRPSTPEDTRLGEIHRRLAESSRSART